jgi:isochorismatase hydrolase
MHNLPTIFTTSQADGPNGPLLPGLKEILPDAPVIHRPGEINAFDNAEFAAAVEKLGRKNCWWRACPPKCAWRLPCCPR